MATLNVLLAFATIFNLVRIVYLTDGDKEIRFFQQSEDSEDYHFEYKLDNGRTFSGNTFKLINQIHVLSDANDVVYWVEIGEEEKNKEEFSKIAHIAQIRKNKIFFEDHNRMKYLFDAISGQLLVTPHDTAWDIDNVCFSRNNFGAQIFNFTITSINNSRKFNGVTQKKVDEALIQRIDVLDESISHGKYEIKFTESELSENKTFCRGVTRIISGTQWLIAPLDRIFPPCLISCVG